MRGLLPVVVGGSPQVVGWVAGHTRRKNSTFVVHNVYDLALTDHQCFIFPRLYFKKLLNHFFYRL